MGSRHDVLMLLRRLRFGLNLARFPHNTASFNYSDWQEIEALGYAIRGGNRTHQFRETENPIDAVDSLVAAPQAHVAPDKREAEFSWLPRMRQLVPM
jgi:hypothetical protein